MVLGVGLLDLLKKKKKKNHNTQQPIVYIEKNSTKQPSSWITQ